MAFVGGMFASVAGPCIKATMINVNDPESRGVALALQVRDVDGETKVASQRSITSATTVCHLAVATLVVSFMV